MLLLFLLPLLLLLFPFLRPTTRHPSFTELPTLLCPLLPWGKRLPMADGGGVVVAVAVVVVVVVVVVVSLDLRVA